MAEKSKKIKVNTIIPNDPLNPNNKTFEITINGKTYRIARGVMVELDENVFEVLKEHLALSAQINIGRINEHEN